MTFRIACLGFFLLSVLAIAAEPEPIVLPPGKLAARLSAKQWDGDALVRAKMDLKDPDGAVKTTLQLQIKSRVTRTGAEVVYQVLWPRDRRGEAVLLSRAGNHTSGVIFNPPDSTHPIEAGQMREPLFSSDLSYDDAIENFFAWNQQALVGNEMIDRTKCVILESKPAKGQSAYSRVRTWVDMRRLVPLRVEKYDSTGKVVRRIDTTRIVTDDKDRPIPGNLAIRGSGDTVTDIDGSRIKHSVSFSDEEFTADGLRLPIAARGEEE